MEPIWIYVHMLRVWVGECFIALGVALMPEGCEQDTIRRALGEYYDWKDME